MPSLNRRVRSRAACIVWLAAAVAVVGCAPRIDVHGHIGDPDALDGIRPGVQTQAQVAELLGTPTAVATFDDARWYYVTRRTETVSFYDPELTAQRVVAIAFDENGVVESVDSFAAEEARAIDPADDETPTRGRSFGLLEQLFGNIGRPAALGR